MKFCVTDSAKKRIGELIAKQDGDSYFRIQVDGGGCSGFQYKFSFDKKVESDRLVDGVVVIDESSMPFVDGASLDFEEDLGGSHFSVKNPNATASCGCGNSFAV